MSNAFKMFCIAILSVFLFAVLASALPLTIEQEINGEKVATSTIIRTHMFPYRIKTSLQAGIFAL